MKTEREIREKISELMEKVKKSKRDGLAWTTETKEQYGAIDALLWVIGDNSGKAI